MIGSTVAHYRILAKLGEGGMGVVYRAEDTRLERQVALKILPEELAGDAHRLERFQREAKAIAALNHPSIVTVYSVEEADGIHFLTMELVEGRSLRELIRPGGMPLGRLLAIARPLAEAVSAAHGRGVVHRDLKPANIMVTDEGRVKVLDFGLAKVAAVSGTADPGEERTELLTEPGRVMGTAPYMSPEQVKGGVVDARSDIFSLGIIFYEMATGNRPFRGETPAELVSSTLRDAPTAVSEVRGDLPRQLGRIIGRCLTKDVERRYQTAKDVRNDLEGLEREATAEVLAPPRPVGKVRRRWALAVAAVALAVLSAVLGHLARRSSPAPGSAYAIAVPPLENLIGEPGREHLPAGIASGLISALSGVSQLRVVSRAETWDAASRGARGAALARRLGVNALVEGEVQSQGEQLHVGVRLVDGGTGRVLGSRSFEAPAEEIFALQRSIADWLIAVLEIALTGQERRRLQQDPSRSFRAYESYLRAEEHLGRQDDPQGPREAAALFRQAIEADEGFALAHAALSEALWKSFVFHPQDAVLSQAESAARKALELDPGLPAAQVALARVQRSTGRLEESIRGIEEALEDHPNPAEARRELAYAYERAGDPERAERLLRDAATLAGDDWYSWNLLGTFLARRGRYEAARRIFEKADAIAPADVYLPRENLAAVDISLGRFRDAVEAFERLPPGTAGDRPRLASNIGTAYFFSDREDRLERALEHFRRAVELRPAHAGYRRNLGDAYRALGREDQALDEYRRALSLKEAELERDPTSSSLRLDWAQYAAKTGECERALPVAEELAGQLPDNGPNDHQLAYVWALCGRREMALAALERAVAREEPFAVLRLETEFFALHGDPRFEALASDGPPDGRLP